ncbi:hypothetical protein HLK59_30455 [Streptomyces sp. S3(2020)]|uniref:hypothetical protein n=1 Tax=Streptomyces sp. S3(2020) TaxID=2732044 RepID=UPI001489B5D8|nr:hypothetical protein [Streptomyces sp. S3(2020)]NNN34606.1 hypothetical protein [Streptomyces sp. S3(2020)]
MEATPYDLGTLLWEIQQTMNAGGLDGQDLGRLSTLVLDRLGCRTAGQAYDRLYDDWTLLPSGTLLSGVRAGQVLSVLPLLRLDQPLADRRREDELLRAAREHGPSDTRWQADVLVKNLLFGVQHLREPADMEEALARIEEARAAHPDGGPVRDQLDILHAGLHAQLAQLGGGEDDYDVAVDDFARLTARPGLDEGSRTMMRAQLALFRVHQAIRRDDEAMLAEQVRVLDSTLARLPPGHMDRLAFTSNMEAARGYLAVMRAQRTGRLDPVPEGARNAVPLAEARRRIADLPLNAQADKLAEAAFSRGMRAMTALDYHGTLEARPGRLGVAQRPCLGRRTPGFEPTPRRPNVVDTAPQGSAGVVVDAHEQGVHGRHGAILPHGTARNSKGMTLAPLVVHGKPEDFGEARSSA